MDQSPNSASRPFPRAYYAIAGVVLLAQLAFFRMLPPPGDVPLKQPLASLPQQAGNWTAIRETSIDPASAAVLRADDTLSRDYANASRQSAVNLFVAYFRSQQQGRSPHSPQHCMPGAGWEPVSLHSMALPVPGRREPIAVNEYIVSRGDARAVVLYWYQSGERAVASEYLSKIYLVLDSIRYGRSNTALVRVTVTSSGPTGDAAALADAVDFVKSSFGSMRQVLSL